MSCGISDKAKVLTDKLDELDNKIDEALNDIPGVAEAQAFVDDLEANINKIKDDVMAQIPIIGGGSLPPEMQSLQADVEKAIGFVMQGVDGVQNMKGQMDYMKEKWGDIDLGDIKSLDDLGDLITNGAADLDNLCSMVPNFTPSEDGSFKLEVEPITIPDIDFLGVVMGDDLPTINKPKLKWSFTGGRKRASGAFSNTEIARISP